MNAMELRELAQEALDEAQKAQSPGTRMRWLKTAGSLAALAREQGGLPDVEETVRRRADVRFR